MATNREILLQQAIELELSQQARYQQVQMPMVAENQTEQHTSEV